MTPQELACAYPLIEERVGALVHDGAAVAAETFSEDRDVRRFFRRLGVIPRRQRAAAASRTVLDVIEAVSHSTAVDADRARTVLSAYCRSDGELASVCSAKPKCDRCPLAPDCAFPSKKPTIKDLPEGERPRERLLKLGEEQLTDAELLAIILGGGMENVSAVELARKLLAQFGTFRKIASRSPAELRAIRGIGDAKSAAIKAAMEIARRFASEPGPERGGAFLNPKTVFERYRMRFGSDKREIFIALLLDAKNRLIRDVVVSQGSLTQSIVHPREAFEPAIRNSAASVLFIHNHPSGDPTPSREDIEITKRLKQTGELVGIRVLDHVVIGEAGYASLADQGLL